MIRWQIELMWPLVIAFLLIACFTLYVFIHSERRYRLKMVLVPALLATAAFSFTWFGGRLGYAAPAPLPQNFEYVTHRLVVEDNRKAWVDILLVSRKPLQRDARLHRLPWSKPLEDALKQAQRMQREGGGRIEIDSQGRGDPYPQWVPRRVLPQDDAPKGPFPSREDDLLAPVGPMT